MKDPPKDLQGVDVADRRGSSIPLDVPFVDERGVQVRLGDYFDGQRPVLLAFVYYDCPMLCNLMLADMAKMIRDLKFDVGQEYRVVMLSFDHTNTPAQAAGKKAEHVEAADRDGAEEGWAFLVGSEPSIREVTEAAGFSFNFLPASGEYAHESVVYVLSPSGSISNILYGRYPAQWKERDLRLALSDASEGKIGTVFDRIVAWCYMYDPNANSYVLQAVRVMQAGGILTMSALGALVGGLFWTGRRRRASAARTAPEEGRTR